MLLDTKIDREEDGKPNTMNDSIVTVLGDNVGFVVPPTKAMNAAKAARAAAWLYVMCGVSEAEFLELADAVRNS